MQVALTADRTVRQYGDALGELDGCTIEEVADETMAAILAALPAHGGGVRLGADHAAVTPNEEPPQHRAWLAAQEQRRADLATLAASDDPALQAMARLLGHIPA